MLCLRAENALEHVLLEVCISSVNICVCMCVSASLPSLIRHVSVYLLTLNFLFCGETFFVLLHHLNPVFEELFHDCIKRQHIRVWRLRRMCRVRVTQDRFIVLQPGAF